MEYPQPRINPAFQPKVRKTDGWKLGESSPEDADEPYVGSYAALLGEPSLKGEGEVSNSRMNQ